MTSNPSDFERWLGDAMALAQQGREALRSLPEIGDLSVGLCDRKVVYTEGKLKLYRYAPLARALDIPPLLICYAMVNRPYMLDLQPDRSLIRQLLFLGLDVYLIDWGYPDGADRFTPLEDYICGALHHCVESVLESHHRDAVNVLGVCQGGTFSLCYAALEPSRVQNLITMVTPVDFKTPENLLSKWTQHIDFDLLTQSGNVPGELLNLLFIALSPYRLSQQKYVNLLKGHADRGELEYFMRMEKWIFDSPDQPAAAFKEFVEWFYKENRLVRGELMLDGRTVSLENVTCPVLNIYAKKDHLVPPSASIPLGAHVGSDAYESLVVDVGHIGMYVSGRAQNIVAPEIAKWLTAHR